jgi:hypothetical protein
MATLTHHKKAVRALAMGKREFSFVSAAADNMKRWQVSITTTTADVVRCTSSRRVHVRILQGVNAMTSCSQPSVCNARTALGAAVSAVRVVVELSNVFQYWWD